MKLAGIEIWIEHEIEEGEQTLQTKMAEHRVVYDRKTKIGQAYVLNSAQGNVFTVHCNATEAFQTCSDQVASFGLALYMDGEFIAQAQTTREHPQRSFLGLDTKDGHGFFPFRFLQPGENPKALRNIGRWALRDCDDAITIHICRHKTIIQNYHDGCKPKRAIDVHEEPLMTSALLGYGIRREYNDFETDTAFYTDEIDDYHSGSFQIFQLSFRNRNWMVGKGFVEPRRPKSPNARKSKDRPRRNGKKQSTGRSHSTPLPPSCTPDGQVNDSNNQPPQLPASVALPISRSTTLDLLRHILPALERYQDKAEEHGLEYDVMMALRADLLLQGLIEDIGMRVEHANIVMKWVEYQRSIPT